MDVPRIAAAMKAHQPSTQARIAGSLSVLSSLVEAVNMATPTAVRITYSMVI